MRTTSRIEALESRIAPALTIVGPHVATYDDVDGDHVTVTVSLLRVYSPLSIMPGRGRGRITGGCDFSKSVS
jgi:hypothetical protein